MAAQAAAGIDRSENHGASAIRVAAVIMANLEGRISITKEQARINAAGNSG